MVGKRYTKTVNTAFSTARKTQKIDTAEANFNRALYANIISYTRGPIDRFFAENIAT